MCLKQIRWPDITQQVNIALYVHDLNVENGHLMPWRTVLEVAVNLIAAGHNATVLSGVSGQPGHEWVVRGTRVRRGAKTKERP